MAAKKNTVKQRLHPHENKIQLSQLIKAVMTARMRLRVSWTAGRKQATPLTNNLGIAQNSELVGTWTTSAPQCKYPTAASLIHRHWCPCQGQARTEFIDKKSPVAASTAVSVPLQRNDIDCNTLKSTNVARKTYMAASVPL